MTDESDRSHGVLFRATISTDGEGKPKVDVSEPEVVDVTMAGALHRAAFAARGAEHAEDCPFREGKPTDVAQGHSFGWSRAYAANWDATFGKN